MTLGTLRPAGGWREPAVRKVVALFGPMLVGTGVAQLSTLIDVQIASFISDQSVATLAYAQRLYLLPLSLFGVAIAQVALPTLSHDAARSGERILAELGAAWRRMAFLMLPSALALAAFGRPAVSLLFERGRFDAGDSTAVTWVLAAYGVGLLAYGAVRLFATAFYAVQDTRTPVRVAVGALVVNAVLGITFALLLGTPGIALATALAAIANATALGAILRGRLGRLPGSIRTDTPRMTAATLVAGALAALPYIWMLASLAGLGASGTAAGSGRPLRGDRRRLSGRRPRAGGRRVAEGPGALRETWLRKGVAGARVLGLLAVDRGLPQDPHAGQYTERPRGRVRVVCFPPK